MTGRRTLVNLVAIAAASAALLLYAFTQLLVGALTETTYPLSVRLAESGGLFPGQEVTLSGRVIGTVDDVGLEGETVVVLLGILRDERVPADLEVTVLRRSPIGEQAIDLRPRTGEEPFLEPGDVIDGLDATVPVPVQRLLEAADRVFAPVDAERAGVLLGEVADAVRGRRDDIRGIITDSATFSAALAANERDIERFFSASRVVNAALADSREALVRSLTDMADASDVLIRMREDFQGLLVEAPPVLDTVTGLVSASQANLHCSIRSLAELNTMLAEPKNLENLEEALRLNRWFFVGFDIGGAADPEGRIWNRIQFMPPQADTPQSYLPDKRPIPDILPGAACDSPFGPGAGEATQPDFESVTVENEVVPPSQPAAASAPTMRPMSAAPSGGSLVPVLMGVALLGALARRSATLPPDPR